MLEQSSLAPVPEDGSRVKRDRDILISKLSQHWKYKWYIQSYIGNVRNTKLENEAKEVALIRSKSLT